MGKNILKLCDSKTSRNVLILSLSHGARPGCALLCNVHPRCREKRHRYEGRTKRNKRSHLTFFTAWVNLCGKGKYIKREEIIQQVL